VHGVGRKLRGRLQLLQRDLHGNFQLQRSLPMMNRTTATCIVLELLTVIVGCKAGAGRCKPSEVCIYPWPDKPCECRAVAHARTEYTLPLRGPQGAFCFHGTRDSDPKQTHAFQNTFFAVDLASPLDGPPSEVVAARAGKVVRIHAGCVDPGISQGHADDCGHGFGNWVVIDHGDGEASFYAHLARVDAAEGDVVRAGQKLGIEGITGSAGSRHVHFSVHRVDGPPAEDGIGWFSIPYRLTYRPSKDAAPVHVEIVDLSCTRNFVQPPMAWNPL
jgi:murein DD-endopeptidase MepM/ murein hydrolase activator NlpD